MSQKTVFILIIVVIVAVITALGIGMMAAKRYSQSNIVISNFEECAAAGYPIMESYPEQCRTPDGRNFVHEIPPQIAAFKTPVTLYWPSVAKKATFQDGLVVTLVEIGDSRCKPDVVCIWAGELTANLHVTGGAIMTGTEFSLGTERVKTYSVGGYTFTLIGATEASATITVTKGVIASECYVGGCSGQICSNQKDVVTTCEYKAEYACYKEAACEKQANGQCGWTQTATLAACLEKSK